jgi:hypothetical protein
MKNGKVCGTGSCAEPGTLTLVQFKINYKQDDHDGPEIAHLYIGPWANANFKPGTFIEQTWLHKTAIRRCFMINI